MRISSMICGFILLLGSSMTAMSREAPPQARAARIDHIAIQVSDVDRAVAFYQSLFGLKELPAPVKIARWLDLGGGVALHIIGGRTKPVDDIRTEHIALSVDNLEAFLDRVNKLGLTFTNLRGEVGQMDTVRAEGVKQLFVRDPDGHYIEVNNVLEVIDKPKGQP